MNERLGIRCSNDLFLSFFSCSKQGQCKVGPLKVIRRFAYATILCTLTFAICMIPFAADTDPKWETGVWRIINVVVGCILGALGSIVVCPKSTTDVLLNKTAKQVQLAGEACEALLHTAADFFAGRVQVNRLADELLTAPLETTLRWKLTRSTSTLSADSDGLAKADVALKKYEDAIGDWRELLAAFVRGFVSYMLLDRCFCSVLVSPGLFSGMRIDNKN